MKRQVALRLPHLIWRRGLAERMVVQGDATAAVASTSAAAQFWHSFDATNRGAGRARLALAESLWAEGSNVAAGQALEKADSLLSASAFTSDRALPAATRGQLAR